eukprot:357247-Pyramimonas_sp.AAC.1
MGDGQNSTNTESYGRDCIGDSQTTAMPTLHTPIKRCGEQIAIRSASMPIPSDVVMTVMLFDEVDT